jgi:mercuric ion transport protein
MKTAWGAVATAFAASLCCTGPVMGVLVGAGALGASATKLQPLRPPFLILTIGLLGFAFYRTYRPRPEVCADESICPPSSTRMTKFVLWFASVLVLLLVAFPYYVTFLF